ncbi:hypothetical protein C8R45DRAFT_848371 [Mycena sanguinolenta]|nr:hypothetical protein C8R45DRAFT_848371 [Mycena sanguinolenta]
MLGIRKIDAFPVCSFARLISVHAPRNALGESRRVISWIWTTWEGSGDDEQDLHDSIRVEWSRARARKTRWQEETELLQEEMRYMEWQAVWWEARLEAQPTVSQHLKTALRAYMSKQVWLHRRVAAHFKSQWETSKVTDLAAVMESADLAQFFKQQ